jgi:CarD family transcriptional regulator
MVPVDNVDGVGLRRAIDGDDVKKLFNLLGNGKIENHQNWKGRFKDNSDKMRTGSIRDVIDVLKSLNCLSKSKNLSFREKRMLDRSKFLVVSEISEVMGETVESVEGRVDKALDRCLVNRAKRAAKAKTTKSKTAKAKVAKSKVANKAKVTKAKTVKAKVAKAKTTKAKTVKAKVAKVKVAKAKAAKAKKSSTGSTLRRTTARAS